MIIRVSISVLVKQACHVMCILSSSGQDPKICRQQLREVGFCIYRHADVEAVCEGLKESVSMDPVAMRPIFQKIEGKSGSTNEDQWQRVYFELNDPKVLSQSSYESSLKIVRSHVRQILGDDGYELENVTAVTDNFQSESLEGVKKIQAFHSDTQDHEVGFLSIEGFWIMISPKSHLVSRSYLESRSRHLDKKGVEGLPRMELIPIWVPPGCMLIMDGHLIHAGSTLQKKVGLCTSFRVHFYLVPRAFSYEFGEKNPVSTFATSHYHNRRETPFFDNLFYVDENKYLELLEKTSGK